MFEYGREREAVVRREFACNVASTDANDEQDYILTESQPRDSASLSRCEGTQSLQ